jgi:hypothetical protein
MALIPPRQNPLQFSIQTLFCLLTISAVFLALVAQVFSPSGGTDMYLFVALPILGGSCSLLGARISRFPPGASDCQLQLAGSLLSAAGLLLLAIWTAMAIVLAISLLGWVDKP